MLFLFTADAVAVAAFDVVVSSVVAAAVAVVAFVVAAVRQQ